MMPLKIPFNLPRNIPTVFDEESTTVIELCGKTIAAINTMIDELTAFETSVTGGLSQQDQRIEQYKLDLQAIVDDYKLAIEGEMISYRDLLRYLYERTLDVYNKAVLQFSATEIYIDNAITDFGSIATWSISNNDELVATVFNNNLLISIGMTDGGRLEVTTDD